MSSDGSQPEAAPPSGPRAASWPGVGLAALVGLASGLGAYTFYYADGASYFSADPAACANCHVMWPEYDGWAKSSHRAAAGCNDCHAPHDAPIAKLWVKGVNGFRHSWAFTLGGFPEPIRITGFNRTVTERACRHCHDALTHAIDAGAETACLRCHGAVGHSR